MNKFLKIQVSKDVVTLYQNDFASPQQVMATLDLFSDVGNVITLQVCQLDTCPPAK